MLLLLFNTHHSNEDAEDSPEGYAGSWRMYASTSPESAESVSVDIFSVFAVQEQYRGFTVAYLVAHPIGAVPYTVLFPEVTVAGRDKDWV